MKTTNEWNEALYGEGTALVLPEAYKELLRAWAKDQMALVEWNDYWCTTPDGRFDVNLDTPSDGIRCITVYPNSMGEDGGVVTDVDRWMSMYFEGEL